MTTETELAERIREVAGEEPPRDLLHYALFNNDISPETREKARAAVEAWMDERDVDLDSPEEWDDYREWYGS